MESLVPNTCYHIFNHATDFENVFEGHDKFRKRMGLLFIKNFKRELILDKEHFITAIMYTHRNPIHHGFRIRYDEWENSSYEQIKNGESDVLEIKKTLEVFNNKSNLIASHLEYLENWKSKFISIDMNDI